MITFRSIARNSAAQYFRDDLKAGLGAAAIGKYYLQDGARAPKWEGELVEHFGLDRDKPPTQQQLQRLLDGYHPITGENMLKRRDADRRQGYDIVCTAPKSVSILGVLYDQRIPAMVRAADRIAMQQLEEYACVRVRKAVDVYDERTGTLIRKQQNHDEKTGKMIILTVEHPGSRELDPNLHSHHVTPNLTLSKEGELKALSPVEALRRCRLFTEIFRNSLAAQLKEAGYKLRQSGDSFEIEGVPKQLIKTFSKSSAKIKEEEAKLEKKKGAKLTNDERAEIAAKVKNAKNKRLTQEEVRSLQMAQIPEETHKALQALVKNACSISPLPRPSDTEAAAAAAECAEHGKKHVFEREAITETWKIAEHSLRHSQGRTTWPMLKKAIGNLDLVRDGTTCTTEEMQNLEHAIVNFAWEGREKYEILADRNIPTIGLTEEQRQMASQVCGSKDQVTLVEAPPGAGKSFTLKAIYASLNQCVAVAPTASAVEVLAGDGLPAQTLDSLLNDNKNHAKVRVVICDEASLLSTAQATRLIECAKQHNWRLVLQGDRRQAKSVGAGSPFALLLEHTKAARGELTEIKRQKDPLYRAAVQEMSKRAMGRGLEILKTMKAISEFPTADERREATAELVCDALEKGSVCAVAPTWHEIMESTDAIRKELRMRGKLAGREAEFDVYQNVDMTLAQRRHRRYWDDTALFYCTRRIGKMPLGTVGTFINKSGEEGKYVVKDSRGQCHLIAEADLSATQPVRAAKVRLATGDKILLQANSKCEDKRQLTNGTVAEIACIDRGRITLTDGRVLPEQYNRFTLGYVTTPFSAQGMTADSAIAIFPSGPGVTRSGLFVALTRGKQNVALICDDYSLLQGQVVNPIAEVKGYEHAIDIPTDAERRRKRTLERSSELARQAAGRNTASQTRPQQQTPSRTPTGAGSMGTPGVNQSRPATTGRAPSAKLGVVRQNGPDTKNVRGGL